MTSLIDVNNVTVTLPSLAGDVNILKGINLSMPKGEALGIVGPSGCGKTTLLMVLAGLEPPSSGHVRIGDTDFAAVDEDALARFRRQNIGIVFQSFHLIPTMTALENVALPLELSNDGQARQAAAALALDEVGLAHRGDHYPSQLSGGEQQRVALARAMIADPVLLLADEPTGNLDQTSGHQIMDLIFSLQEKKGTSLVLITHDPVLAARCDRVARLRDGLIESIDAKDLPAHTGVA